MQKDTFSAVIALTVCITYILYAIYEQSKFKKRLKKNDERYQALQAHSYKSLEMVEKSIALQEKANELLTEISQKLDKK